MMSSTSVLQKIFRKVFLKKRKKARGRYIRNSNGNNLKRQNDNNNNGTRSTANDVNNIDTNNSNYNNNNNNNNTLSLKSQTLSIPSTTTNGRISSYGGGDRLSSVGSQRKDWRSGHKLVDNLIQGIRLDFPFPSHHLSWIPFDEFVGLKFVSRGGFSAIYESMWTNTGQTVALKCLDGSQDFSTDFLDEIKSHWCLFSQPQFLRCHGITQLPNSREFMMVMQYALFGDLRSHLQRTRIFTWKEKIRILKQIARGIAEMHKRNLIHGNIHSGNILNVDRSHFVIADTGLCGPANKELRKKKAIYGVLPYVAPELLKGYEYTKKADIYSFGIIMWEISAGIRPFSNSAHNLELARDICNSKRPPIPIGTPEFYSKLMNSCWDTNPNKRPEAHDVLKTVYHWLVNDSLDDHLRKAGGSTISSFSNMGNDRTNPEAIYYSRLLEFPELKNTKLQQHQSLSVPPQTSSNDKFDASNDYIYSDSPERQSFLGVLDQHTDLNRPLSSIYSFASTRIDNNKDDIYSKLGSSNNKRTSVALPDDDLTALQSFWAMDGQISKNKKEPISSSS